MPCLPQDYKDEIEISELVEFCNKRLTFFNPDNGKQPETFGSNILIFNLFLTFLVLYIEYTILLLLLLN